MHPEEENDSIQTKKTRADSPPSQKPTIESDPKFKEFLAVQGIQVNDDKGFVIS